MYIGEWKNNEMHGTGKYFYKDGSIFEGTWENGHKNGFGKLTTKYALRSEWINNIWGQNTTFQVIILYKNFVVLKEYIRKIIINSTYIIKISACHSCIFLIMRKSIYILCRKCFIM